MQIYQLQCPNNVREKPTWVIRETERERREPDDCSMVPYAGALVTDLHGRIVATAARGDYIKFGGWDWSPKWFQPICQLDTISEAQLLLNTGVLVELQESSSILYLVRDGQIVRTEPAFGRSRNKLFWDALGGTAW